MQWRRYWLLSCNVEQQQQKLLHRNVDYENYVTSHLNQFSIIASLITFFSRPLFQLSQSNRNLMTNTIHPQFQTTSTEWETAYTAFAPLTFTKTQMSQISRMKWIWDWYQLCLLWINQCHLICFCGFSFQSKRTHYKRIFSRIYHNIIYCALAAIPTIVTILVFSSE